MMTPGEYRELAWHYEWAAEQTNDDHARERLHSLAQTYLVLASSMSMVERSAELLDRIEKRRKK
jgi:hypothetical protein